MSVISGIRTRRVAAVMVLAGVLMPSAAVSGAAREPAAVPSPPVSGATTGSVLYGQQCASCHGQRGEGTSRGPSLLGVGAASVDFNLSTGRMPLPQGEPYQPRHQRASLNGDQISSLVAYVGSFAPGGQPIPEVQPANVTDGRALFVQYCAACHSAGGVGGALRGGNVAPSLLRATPTQVGEAIRIGPSLMPAFPETVLSPADVNALAKYIQVLQNRDGDLDLGGFALGRLGPLTEGLVAWIGGLLLLVLAARWLGSKSP